MLNPGDVLDLDLGPPEGREAGFRRPAVVVTAQRILEGSPSVVHVVPLTSTIRLFGTETIIDADPANGLGERSAVQCQHLRAISTSRVRAVGGNVGTIALAQIRETIGVILDLPS